MDRLLKKIRNKKIMEKGDCMRIVLFTGGFEYGGAQRVLCNLANAFASNKKNDVTIIMATYAAPTYFVADNVKLINGLNWKNYLDGVLKLKSCLKELKPDIIISFAVQYNIAMCIANFRLKSKVIISERNDPKSMPHQKYLKFLRWLTYRFSHGYVFQTEDARDYFGKKIIRKSTVISNPLYLTDDIPELTKREHIIISASRYVPQKNLSILIKAFTENSSKYPDWKLEMYGDGPEGKNLIDLVEQYGMEEKIKVNSATSEIHEVMRKSSIFVLTSNFEGMPNSLMEAMGEGAACISTDCPCGGPKYLIKNGVSGYLISVGDSKELAQKLDLLMGNDELRNQISMEAVKIRDRLSPEIIINSWMDYIYSVMKK